MLITANSDNLFQVNIFSIVTFTLLVRKRQKFVVKKVKDVSEFNLLCLDVESLPLLLKLGSISITLPLDLFLLCRCMLFTPKLHDDKLSIQLPEFVPLQDERVDSLDHTCMVMHI